MKNKIIIILLLTLPFYTVVNFTTVASFAEDNNANFSNLSEEKKGLISQNCGTIRQSLKNLQRTDSHARTYFGAIYETVSSKFITPLNLRLVKNNISSTTLMELQTNLASSKSKFSSDFIDYSKSLEELINIDCRLNPNEFYAKLIKTRQKRATVAADLKKLNELVTSSVSASEKIKEKLDE